MSVDVIKPGMWCPGFRTGHPLANGLVALWPLWSGSGERAMDVSGNGNLGTLTNLVPAADWLASEKGNVLGNFLKAGTDGYVDLGAPLTFSGADYTSATSFWWYRDASGDAILFGDSSTQFNLFLFYDGTGSIRHFVAIDEGGGNQQGFVDYDITLNTWHHEVLNRYDATHVEIYVDGVSRGTASNANWAGVPSHIETIGASTTGGFGLDGMMEMVGLWNRSLSNSEITQLCEQPYTLIEPPSTMSLFSVAASPAVAVTGITRRVGGDGSFKRAGNGGGLAA